MGFCRPSSGPSSGLPGSMMPSVDKSFSVWVIGSNMARLAPPTGLGMPRTMKCGSWLMSRRTGSRRASLIPMTGAPPGGTCS